MYFMKIRLLWSKGILMNLGFLSDIFFIADTDSLELMYNFKGAKLFPNSISSSILTTNIWLRLAPG